MSPLGLPTRILACLVTFAAAAANADVACPPIFGDHMVLQRDLPVPVWGTAAPGERVTVEFAAQRQTATADTAGRWRVNLEPLTASTEPRPLVVRGANTLTFAGVLVGEVWLCSGQSNMEKPFGPRRGQRPVDDHDLEIAAASYPQLRLYQVPRTDLRQDGPGVFRWLPSSPEALKESEFSAAAWYFGRQLHQTLGVPVGLIHASFGGTRIEAWLPPDAFRGDLAGLEKQSYFAWVKGVQATELWQSMVAPLAPFAVRGFLWYQGEANLIDGDIAPYGRKQAALVEAWRRAWARDAAPFYGVLLAPMAYSLTERFPVTALALPTFREQQVAALSAPGTGYVVTTDTVDDPRDIHPTNKRDIGLRLARLALADTYGRTDIAARGPTFANLRIEGAEAILSFDHAAGIRTHNRQPPAEFTVAGADRVFHPATARIADGKVIVTSPAVPQPVALRFGWHETAMPNLFNAADLPAVPFRTDDWPVEVSRPAPAAK